MSASEDRTIKVWDIASGECVRTFEGHAAAVTSLAISADGRRMLSGSEDKSLRVWELPGGRQLRRFSDHDRPVQAAALSPDGCLAFSGCDDGTVMVWKVGESLRAPFRLTYPRSTASLARETSEVDKHFRQAQLAMSEQEWGQAASHLSAARNVAGHSKRPDIVELWGTLYTKLPKTRFRGSWVLHCLEGHESGVSAVTIAADNQCILSASWDHSIRRWDLQTGVSRGIVIKQPKPVTAVAYSSIDDRIMYSAQADSFQLGSCSREQAFRILEGHTKEVSCLRFSADSRFAYSGSLDGTIREWEANGGECLQVLEGHKDAVTSISLSADGHFLLSGSWDETVRLWDLRNGTVQQTLKGHDGNVSAVALSFNRQLAVSGGWDSTVRLWNFAGDASPIVLEGHTEPVSTVGLTTDGDYAVSGSWDSSLRLWDVRRGECLHEFEGHTAEVTSVAISADGRYVVSGSKDGTSRVWYLDWDLAERQAADWDEGALPYVQHFLMSCPREDGKPVFDRTMFERLLHTLGCAGFGWLRPAGVQRKVKELSTNWQPPPPPIKPPELLPKINITGKQR